MGNIEEALSWNNLTEQAADLGIGGDGNFLTLEDGENVVRVLTEPIHYGLYFIDKGIKPIFAKNADDEVKTKHKITHRFACYVYNDKVKKLQIAEFGWSIAKAIGEFSESSQSSYKGIPPYDIIIKKSGADMLTRYVVMPGRNEEPMSKEILEELDKAQTIQEYLDERVAKQAGEDANPNATEEEKKS